MLSGCAPLVQPPLSPFVTTFYDRNRDGVVDFELHDQPQMADDAWALCDLDFDALYDVKIRYSASVLRERTSSPVPRTVRITPGKPPVFQIP